MMPAGKPAPDDRTLAIKIFTDATIFRKREGNQGLKAHSSRTLNSD